VARWTPAEVAAGDGSTGAPSSGHLLSRSLVQVFIASLGGMTSFYLLLSVVPLYATTVGAGEATAGLATTALMLSTVATELVTPWLANRFGYRVVFAAGLVLLGAPAIALIDVTGLPAIVAIAFVRGLGFAIVVVAGSALVPSLVPPSRRGEGLGLYGVVVGVPAVVALPAGVWLTEQVGYGRVFVVAGVAAMLGLVAMPGLPGRSRTVEPVLGFLAAVRTPALVGLSLRFAATTVAAGVVVTFVPLAVSSAGLAALALLVQSVATTGARWWAGLHGDRHDVSGLLAPGLGLVTLGMLLLVLVHQPSAVLAGMLVFGAGFGMTQNVTITMMFDRVTQQGYGAVSGLWNLAYDAGVGIGAAGFGVLAVQAGYPGAFATTAALVLVATIASVGHLRGGGDDQGTVRGPALHRSTPGERAARSDQ
jgi:predicted MFS family arabinose efflux permease